jgi:hypothetical protein
MDYETMVEESFDIFIEDFELDSEGSINDMLFELFAAGFESAIELLSDDDDEDEEGEE